MFCQLPDLVSHYCKAFSCLSCPGRFNRGIQRKKIRLRCDILYIFNNIADFIGSFFDPFHSCRKIMHLILADLRFPGNLVCSLMRIVCCLCIFRYIARNLRYCRQQFFHGTRLVRSSFRKALGAFRHLRCSRFHLLGSFLYFPQSRSQVAVQSPYGHQHASKSPHIRLVSNPCFHRKVAVCHFLQQIIDISDNLIHPVHDHSCRFRQYHRFVFRFDQWERRLQVPVRQQMQTFRTLINRFSKRYTDSLGSLYRNENGYHQQYNNDNDPNH